MTQNANEVHRISNLLLDDHRENHTIGAFSVWLTWAILGGEADLEYLRKRVLQVLPDVRRNYSGERGR